MQATLDNAKANPAAQNLHVVSLVAATESEYLPASHVRQAAMPLTLEG